MPSPKTTSGRTHCPLCEGEGWVPTREGIVDVRCPACRGEGWIASAMLTQMPRRRRRQRPSPLWLGTGPSRVDPLAG